LLAAWGGGVLVATEVPKQHVSSAGSYLLVLGGGAVIGGFLLAYLNWVRKRLLGLQIVAGYALVVDIVAMVLAALGAARTIRLSVLESVAWAHLGVGLVAIAVFFLFAMVRAGVG
jgi:hypothetical protein